MAYHIDLATHFTEGSTEVGFRADLRTVYAVTRCLEIISEASRRLPAEMKARHPSIAWKDVAGAGNVYRHDYEDVVAQHVWDTVQIDLPPLRAAIERELADIGDGMSLSPFDVRRVFGPSPPGPKNDKGRRSPAAFDLGRDPPPDQAAAIAPFRARRQPRKLKPAKPAISIAQVDGSGAAASEARR